MQVEQFDIHTPALTIREAFSFSAALRLMDVSVEQREDFVDEVISSPISLIITASDWPRKTPGSLDPGVHMIAAPALS